MGSQQSMLYDKMVSQRLVGAIVSWHDIHTNLLQLSIEHKSSHSSSILSSALAVDDDVVDAAIVTANGAAGAVESPAASSTSPTSDCELSDDLEQLPSASSAAQNGECAHVGG